MACQPLGIGTGPFVPLGGWSTAASSSKNGRTVTRTAAGIQVQGPSGPPAFHATLGGHVSKYLQFGDAGHVLILESETSGVAPSRNVTIVDFSSGSAVEKFLFNSTSSSVAVNEPVVHVSPGTGSVFLVWSSSGTQLENLAIRRGDTGDVLCSATPFAATLQVSGEATASQLQIKHGGSVIASCPLPVGQLKVSPNTTQTFADVVVGGDCPPTLAQKTFTLSNAGTDCLKVDGISAAAPFSVATSKTLPAELKPGEGFTATVTFAPTAVGTFGPTALAVSRTPANGDAQLSCKGKGVPAVAKISFPAAHDFGHVPVGTAAAHTVTLKNVGDKNLTVTVPPPAGGPFGWGGFAGLTLPCGGGTKAVPLTFAPAAEGDFSATLTVTNTAGTPDHITLTGSGCIPNAVIDAPPAPFPDFGPVGRGFRTVRYILVKNPGDAPLTFQAHVTGADQALFSLVDPDGSLTGDDKDRAYTVHPKEPCGPTPAGPGEVAVAVSFFANDAPRAAAAELVVDAHNGTNTPPASFTYPLTAQIVPGVAVDAVLVLDRSGSMADPVGSRTKSAAEIAAATLFAQLLRPDDDDRLAVVRFNHLPDVLAAFAPAPLTAAAQAAAAAKVNPTDLAPAGATSIVAGVFVGQKEFATARATAPAVLNKVMVVLTDGKDNTAYQDPGTGNWYSVMGGTAQKPAGGTVAAAPMPVADGYKLYGVGLGKGEDVDKLALNALSSATGGYYGVVGDMAGKTYFDLEKYFVQIFMDAVTTPAVLDPVYTIAPGDTHKIEFDVLAGDVSGLVVVLDRDGQRLPFHLRTPTGERLEPAVVPPGYQLRHGATATARFVEFRTPVGEPARYAGRWAVVVEHPGRTCRGQPDPKAPGYLPHDCGATKSPVDYGLAIGVGSNFRLQAFVTPAPVKVGEPILLTGAVSEAGLPVTGCAVTVRAVAPSGATWTVNLYDDGGHKDGAADDGEYAWEFTKTGEAGSYEFTFRAEGVSRDGAPVVREAVRAKYVIGRFDHDPTRPDPRLEWGPQLAQAVEQQGHLLKQLADRLAQMK